MIDTPDESDKLKAERLYSLFSGLPLSDHIASVWSLSHLSALQRLLKPARILEIGAGIGTLTAMLLYSGGSIVSVEPVEEFRKAHKENIGKHPRVMLVSDLTGIKGPFDLAVIDGEFPKGFEDVAPKVMFIEGSRAHQRRALKREFVSYIPEMAYEHHIKPRLKKKGCHICGL